MTNLTSGLRRQRAPGRRKILKVVKRSALRKARSVHSFDARRKCQSRLKSNERSRKISSDPRESTRIRNAFSFRPGSASPTFRYWIATPQKSRSPRLSDDPRGAQNSFGNEAVYIPVSSDKFHLAH